MYRCEHCGSLCHLAPLCGRCGREHGPDFYKEIGLGSKASAIFWSLFVFGIFVLGIIDKFFEIEFLLICSIQIILIPIFFIIAAFWANKHPPKSIILKNGKTMEI